MPPRPRSFALPMILCLCAQGSAKSLRALRTAAPIRMDGQLTEAAWAQAEGATDFTVSWPEFGKGAGLPTEVKVLFDDHYIYVGARMHHPRGRAGIVRRLHRRDQDSASDWFTVYVDSLQDRRTALAFAVNASGVQRDAVHSGDSSSGDTSWDGVWESSVSADPDGWTAKLKIPLSILRIRPGLGAQTWGINFSRSDQGPVRETSYWELPPRGENAFVSRFPELTGLEGIQPRLRREWAPYLGLQRKFETTQSFDDRKWTTRAGLDAHLGLTTNSQLDLSIRPDFGQVEVDQAVLNLGTFETYFPEKRPFFLEGMEIFQVAGNSLFYSRRIGAGLSDPSLGEGEALVDRPQAAEINGAAKYTAKLEGGLSLGVLGASVAQAKATVRTAPSGTEEREIHPLTSYGLLRVQQTLGEGGSYVGGFASAVRQARSDGREAQVQALDTVLKSRDRSTTAEFTLARSQAGTREEGGQRSGYRGRLRLNRQWASGWNMEFQAVDASRSFDPNDMGYLSRADEQRAYLGLQRRWDGSFGVFRNPEWDLEASVARDQAGRVFQRYIGASARTDFTNFFSTWINGGLNLPAEDDRELRTFGDPVKKYLRTEQVPSVNVGFDTPGNRPWYLRADLSRAWFEGGPSTDVSLYQSIKLNSAVEVQLSTSAARDEGERKFVPPPDASPADAPPLTGLRRLGEFNQTLRISYALSPVFSIQFFSQWLDANWAFRDLKRYVDDRTLAPGLPEGMTEPQEASSERVWNLNLISRWEFRPGSTFFLVYTHGTSTDALINDRASLSPRPDLALLRHLPSDDALQVKLTWLFH